MGDGDKQGWKKESKNKIYRQKYTSTTPNSFCHCTQLLPTVSPQGMSAGEGGAAD